MSPDESAVFELLKGYALFSSSQRRIVRLMTLFTETQFGSIKKSKCNVDCLVGWLKGQTEQREKREGGREARTWGTRKIRPWSHVVGLEQRNDWPKVVGSVGRGGRSFRHGKLTTWLQGGDFFCEVAGFQFGFAIPSFSVPSEHVGYQLKRCE